MIGRKVPKFALGGDIMKYFINTTTKTLHKMNGCPQSKVVPSGGKCYKTEDEAIKAETKYFKYCKTCFKENK